MRVRYRERWSGPEKLTQWLNALKLYIPRIIHVISLLVVFFCSSFYYTHWPLHAYIKMFDFITQQTCGDEMKERMNWVRWWWWISEERAHSKLINLFLSLTLMVTWNQSENFTFLFPSSPGNKRQFHSRKLMGKKLKILTHNYRKVKWKITWNMKHFFMCENFTLMSSKIF